MHTTYSKSALMFSKPAANRSEWSFFVLVVLWIVSASVIHAHDSRPKTPHAISFQRRTSFPWTLLSLNSRGGGGTVQKKSPRAARSASTVSKVSKDDSSGASVSMMTFNLVKAILGSGILALPAGIATFAKTDNLNILVPSVILLALTGTIASYGFVLIGVLCDATGAKTYREAWNASLGKKISKSAPPYSTTSWLPAAACLAVTFCTTLTYAMVIADMLPSLLPIEFSRFKSLASLAVVLAPICVLQDLKNLAPVSIVGLVGTLYTAIAMCYRWYEYSMNHPVSLDPSKIDVRSPAIFLSMLSTSFMAHYNAPKVYWELRGEENTPPAAGTDPSTLMRYTEVIQYGFTAAMIVMAMIAASGFAVFGMASASNILSSYPSSDSLMQCARTAIAVSLICTFPLAFVGMRNQFLEWAGLPRDHTPTVFAATFALLIGVTTMAFYCRDLRIILAMGGATWGNAVIYVFPSLMTLHAARQYPQLLRDHVPGAALTGAFGLILAVMGTQRIVSMIRSSS